MLPFSLRQVIGMAGQMHLAVFADDGAGLVHQNAAVEPLGLAAVFDHLREAQAKADAMFRRPVKQRLGFGARHGGFEKSVDLVLIFEIPAREKCRQGELGKDHKVTAAFMGPVQQRQQAIHDL